MEKLDMDKPYLLTQAQRMDLLNSHNNLCDILQTIADCKDIWISQVQHLDTLQWERSRILKFVPKRGEDGHIIWGADWILIEHSKEDAD